MQLPGHLGRHRKRNPVNCLLLCHCIPCVDLHCEQVSLSTLIEFQAECFMLLLQELMQFFRLFWTQKLRFTHDLL